MTVRVKDQDQREHALNPGQSFIVQAPAGSGKTELLIQRYLKLLTLVERPEEIISITFTRKAAAEMRNRILEALESATQPEPKAEHARITWRLARNVLDRNREFNWTLLQLPNRLRIQTIDSLCSSLTKQLPLLSTFGGRPDISNNLEELYFKAARAAIKHLELDEEWSDSVATLLVHLDNNIPKLEGLLVSMLSRRDQWLRHVVNENSDSQRRIKLERALERIVGEVLTDAVDNTPMRVTTEIGEFIDFASNNLVDAHITDHPLVSAHNMDQMPGAKADDLPLWLAVAELLLTKKGDLRKRLNKNDGFPTDHRLGKDYCKGIKARLLDLIGSLEEHPSFVSALKHIRRLPPQQFSDRQWNVMQALFGFLKIAVAELRLVMAETNQVDYIEMAMGAQLALGDEDNPTDLSLALDYRIQHILVDEFQDTSQVQYSLLRQLTRGWEPNDGKTLFVVGDPMQSIYLFREAEVGLYLKARQDGIGHVKLNPINLHVNFRSDSGVVDWVNRVFKQVLPNDENIGTGAVVYSASYPFHESTGQSVLIHPQLNQDRDAEASKVVDLIQKAHDQDDHTTVAVLVRSRSHLASIIPALKQAGIRFQALDVEPLSECSVIYDLVSLTRALLHPADRIAWLSILRAPWCGLSLNDLHNLAGKDHKKTIWELLQAREQLESCSDEGKQRLERFLRVIEHGFSRLRRVALSELIEGTWLLLGGAAALGNETELEQAQLFFELLDEFETGGDIVDFSEFEQALNNLYAAPDTEASNRIQLMTIHGAKGLEFDHVIIPGLGRTPRVDESRLMYWLERNHAGGESDLLLAPIKGADQKEGQIYSYIRSLVTEKGKLEDGRLLYVAATRAKKHLHLLGHAEIDSRSGNLKSPPQTSLLGTLWQAEEVRSSYQDELDRNPLPQVSPSNEATERIMPGLCRIPYDWEPCFDEIDQEIPGRKPESILPVSDPETLEFDWATETARHIGTLVHRYLQRIAQDGLQHWNPGRITNLHSAFANALTRMGVPETELEPAVIKVDAAIVRTLGDEKGKWLLDPSHQDAKSEYALSGVLNQALVNVILDRTFVDKDGYRWIIDFKTGSHEGSDIDSFLDQEQERYRPQMERYAHIFKNIEQRPIKLGLYFPLLSGWRAWEI